MSIELGTAVEADENKPDASIRLIALYQREFGTAAHTHVALVLFAKLPLDQLLRFEGADFHTKAFFRIRRLLILDQCV